MILNSITNIFHSHERNKIDKGKVFINKICYFRKSFPIYFMNKNSQLNINIYSCQLIKTEHCF